MLHGAPVYRSRGKLLPLVYLNEVLGQEGVENNGEANKPANIVVLKADDRSFGLIVEDINHTQEIVVNLLADC